MKNHLLKFLLVLLISTFIESNIVINNIKDYKCINFTGVTIFNLEATSDRYLPKSVYFDLKDGNIVINCSFPELQPNMTYPDNIESDTTYNTESDSYFISDTSFDSESEIVDDSSVSSDNFRLLDESNNINITGVCMIIDQVHESKKLYNNITILNNNNNISFKDDFSYFLNNCTDTVDTYKELDLTISFKQLSNFNKHEKENKITFLFFGLVTSSLPKGYPINMAVYLIKNGFQDKNTLNSTCILDNDIIGGNGAVLGQFNCSIKNLSEIESIDSCVFDKSDYISGVPTDKVLLNPVLSDTYYTIKLIIELIYGLTNTVIKTPSFIIDEIDKSNCNNNGKFTLKGTMSDDFSKNITFELPITSPENVTASCTIKEAKNNEKIDVECQTNEEINGKIQIAQKSIFDENKNELFLIKSYESNEALKCLNSKILTLKELINYTITFRQVCHYNYNKLNKEVEFLFIGLIFQNIKKDDEIQFTVLQSNDTHQYSKDIKCFSVSNVNPAEENYVQAIFNCKFSTDLDNLKKIKILSSKQVSGLEQINEYQKDPNLTDLNINKTVNVEGVGKVIDFYQDNSYIPILEINEIKTDKCKEKGKITIKGEFNEDIKKKFDFEIPLSYPSSTIRCTAPKTKKRVKVSITCKTQKDFFDRKNLIIEPRIIYQKNKELLFVKKYNLEKEFSCADFNQLEKRISEEKYNSNYTFLQTNNFNIPKPGKVITFRIVIYYNSDKKDYMKKLPVRIAYNKKISKLRNLDDDNEITDEEDKDAECDLEKENDGKLLFYNCSAEADISNKSEINNFHIEYDNISGLFEGSTNPIETDEFIEKNLTINYAELDTSKNIIFLKNINISGVNCSETGQFTISGEITDKISSGKIYIDYLNPPDIGAICSFDDTGANTELIMHCHNEDDFELENIMIDSQLIGGKLFIDKGRSAPMTCQIGDDFEEGAEYLSIEGEPEDSQNSTISDNGVGNQYYSKTKSSQGLSGGAITAIVIVSAFVLIGVGVLIALIKNGVFSPKPPVNNSTSIPPLTNSSANII